MVDKIINLIVQRSIPKPDQKDQASAIHLLHWANSTRKMWDKPAKSQACINGSCEVCTCMGGFVACKVILDGHSTGIEQEESPSLSVLSSVPLANVKCWVLFLSLSSLVLQTSILYFLKDNPLWQKPQLEIPGTDQNALLCSCSQVRPLSTLVSSSQSCRYTLDPKKKHMSEAICNEQHLFLPFSYK